MTTWFGYTGHSVSAAIAANYLYQQIATCTQSGNVASARVWVNSVTGTVNVKHAIYSVSAGSPATLLGTSDVLPISSGGYKTFTYPTPVAVVNGTQYAFGWLVNASGLSLGREATGDTYWFQSTTYPTIPGTYAGTSSTGSLFAQELGVELAAAAPVADFTGTPLTGTYPLSVAFTDSSTNTPTSWAWTFGDGGTSTSQNPSHSYAAAGTYTVALVATNAAGSNTKTRTGYVTVSAPVVAPVADFSAATRSGDRPLTVVFTDMSA